MNNNWTPSRFARLAYSAMIENAARIQDEVVKQEAIDKRFGDDALPANRIMRSHTNNLREPSKRDLSSMLKRHDEYIEAIREFEALFEIEEKENMEAFAAAFKERMRTGQ